jgi:hypothetical protein
MPFWSAVERVMSSDSQIARTVPWIACGFLAAIDAAMARARSRSSALGTTSVTRPSRSAVAAVMRSSLPMRAQRSTSPSGTPRATIPIGSRALTIPPLACGSKNSASSAATMMSASFRKYWAPPAAMPCTAATTGFQQRWWSFGDSVMPGSVVFHTFELKNHVAPPLTSAPVQNARSPLACSTTACTASSSRTVRHAHAISSAIRSFQEFSASGRSSVIVATWSSPISRSMVSQSMTVDNRVS